MTNNTTKDNQDVFEDDRRHDAHQKMLDKYDLDGDGKLDAAEQQNIGHDMLRMEDMAKMLKKGLIFVVCTAVGLMISNIGTVYFVVWLTKDVKIASDGVMKNMDGGNVKTEILTDNGMQSCDITGFQKMNDIVYILFTSCGRGRLVLQQESQQGTQGMRRKLYEDSFTTGASLIISDDIWGDNSEYYDSEPCQRGDDVNGFKIFFVNDEKSFWLCENWGLDYGLDYWVAEEYTTSTVCFDNDMIFDENGVRTYLNDFDWWYSFENYCITRMPTPSPSDDWNSPIQSPATPPPTPLPTLAPTTIQPTTTPQPTSAPPALKFSITNSHACALFSEEVHCVGNNFSGQLGTGDQQQRLSPTNMDLDGKTPLQVVTGSWHTCVLVHENDGSVYCVGDNEYGQLGNVTPDRYSKALVQVRKEGDSLTNVKQIAAGDDHTCAILEDGVDSIYCWGRNDKNQLMEVGTDVKFMALSFDRTCIVETSNPKQVQCTNPDSSVTIDTINFDNDVITKLTAGSRHFCALLKGDTAKCFGDNSWGQFGNGSQVSDWSTAQSVLFYGVVLVGITDINAGYSSTCLVANEVPMCFGRNDDYQLGIKKNEEESGDTAYVVTPTEVPVQLPPPEQKTLVSVHVGFYTGHAVFSDNTVYSWGNNEYGTFGDGSENSRKIFEENPINDGGEEAVEMDFDFTVST